MYESETRVYLDPPLDKVREIQLLSCNIPKRLVNFKDRQGILNEENRPIIIIQPGTYSLRGIHAIFLNDTDKAKLFLKNKLVSSTLRTGFVKLIYSPTRFVRLSRTSSGSFTNESYKLVFIHSVSR